MGYHGRASSIVVSGTDVRRPRGQVVRGAGQPQVPAFEPSAALDYELEVVSGRCGGGRPGNVAIAFCCSILKAVVVIHFLVEALCCGCTDLQPTHPSTAETPIPANLCNQMCRAASLGPATSWAAPFQWSVQRSTSLGGRLPALHLLPCMHQSCCVELAIDLVPP